MSWSVGAVIVWASRIEEFMALSQYWWISDLTSRISTGNLSLGMLRLNLIVAFIGTLSVATLGAAEPTYRFAISPAPVADVIEQFTAITRMAVSLPPIEGVGQLPSPGVTGEHTAEQGLEMLLAG